MSKHLLPNEQELLIQLQSGSHAAFSELYRHYSEQLYYNILAMVKDPVVTEELLQDIFVRIWQKREHLHIEQHFAGYLFQVSRNCVIDFFHKIQREQEIYNRIKALATDQYTHIEEALTDKENSELFQKAVAALPPQRRKVFELCKVQGLSYQQASEQLGVSLSTIKDHMAKARDFIKEFILNNQEITLALYLFLCWHREK
ncbi:RNA polymerase sigma factor [Chitinophaga defluvii]|uniref:RNA polymerase sigma-70 factor n=1 Tax=Chitinophaga defluvii TaxID=3163343 RepID=A0ABV2T2D0_9BACT